MINASDDFLLTGTEFELRFVKTKRLVDYAARQAEAILEGRASPSIELRREELTAGDPNRAQRSVRMLRSSAVAATESTTTV